MLEGVVDGQVRSTFLSRWKIEAVCLHPIPSMIHPWFEPQLHSHPTRQQTPPITHTVMSK